MGKPEANNTEGATSSQNQQETEAAPCCNAAASRVCSRSTLKWIVAVLLSINVLLVGLYSLPLLRNVGRHGDRGSVSNSTVPIQASFTLNASASVIADHIWDLERDVWEEIAYPNTKVEIVSLTPLPESNGTLVTFGVVSTQKKQPVSSVALSLIREVFQVLVLGTYRLSLNSSDIFGTASSFHVVTFPGGITIVPGNQHFPLEKVQVLFNFTLHNSIEQVLKNLVPLKQQLRDGLKIKSDENVVVQLSNSKGSTVNGPTVIETSIVPKVGSRLPAPRLKQLANEISSRHTADNLGLNHTLFGKVKEIMLSSYLGDPPSPVPSPAPSPSSHSPMPSAGEHYPPPPPGYHGPAPAKSPEHCHHHHHHHHHHHSMHSYKCKHHHSNHRPVSASPVPSPASSSSFPPQFSPDISNHHSPSSPRHAAQAPISPAPSPVKQPPCHSTLPSSPQPSPRFRSESPSYNGDAFRARAPSAVDAPQLSPRPHHLAPVTTVAKEAPSESPELPFMTSSHSLDIIPPYSLFTCLVMLTGAILLAYTA